MADAAQNLVVAQSRPGRARVPPAACACGRTDPRRRLRPPGQAHAGGGRPRRGDEGHRHPAQAEHAHHAPARGRREAGALQGLPGRPGQPPAPPRRLPRGGPRQAGAREGPGGHHRPRRGRRRGRHPLRLHPRGHGRGAARSHPRADRGGRHPDQDRPLAPRLGAEVARGLEDQVRHRLRGRLRRGSREGGGGGRRRRRSGRPRAPRLRPRVGLRALPRVRLRPRVPPPASRATPRPRLRPRAATPRAARSKVLA